MSQFINVRQDMVTEALDGLVRISGGQLARLDALEALDHGVPAAAAAARSGADLTATMHRARSGRASYVGAAQLAGHVDPGAEAVALILEALAKR